MAADNPLQDRFWLHVGRKPPSYTDALAQRVGGLVVEPPKRSTQGLITNTVPIPYILQHRGVTDDQQLTLIHPDETWITAQAGTAMVTSRTVWIPEPSAHPSQDLTKPAASIRQFERSVSRLAPLRPHLIVVAVSKKWLTKTGPRTELTRLLQDVNSPVGLMVASSSDPFNSVRAIEGLVAIAQSVDDVLLLRSDLAAIGAYAVGAAGGSIGINPTARHYVPPGDTGWADNTDPTPRVLVRGILEWWKGSRIGLQGEDPLFDCRPCPVCHGRSLARFQDETLEAEAARHNVEAWLAIAEKLVDTPPTRRADVWIGLCEQADDYLAELEDRDGILHPPSRQLKSWLEFSRVSAP